MRLLALLALCTALALPAHAAQLTFTFDGSVNSINDNHGDGPAVSMGDYISGTVVYEIDDATLYLSNANSNWYEFPAGSMSFTVNIPGLGETFVLTAGDGLATTYSQIASLNHYWRNEIFADPFSGSPQFAYAYPGGRALMRTVLSDNTNPYEMLSSIDMVDEAADVNFAAVDGPASNGVISADDGVSAQQGGHKWSFGWSMDRLSISVDESPVANESLSFGAVKALY